MGKKITQLATITEVADDDLLVGVDVSDTSGSDNGTNKKFTKATLLDGLAPLNPQLTGWNPDAETWVYHNVDDPTGYFKIEGKDVSANYSVGWRIMFTNGGNVIKGIITAITFTDPDTIITFLHEIDPTDNQALYLLTNSAITENYFSPHKAPLGFPMSPAKWTVELEDTTNRTQASPSSNVWYNMGSLSLSVPIGAWDVSYDVTGYVLGSAGKNDINMRITLSTANNSESDVSWTSYIWNRVDSITTGQQLGVMQTVHREGFLTLSSKASYYLNGSKPGVTSSTDSINFYNSNQPCIIRATCAYL